MEIFKLFGSIFVNTDAAEQSIQKTTTKAEGFASKLGSGISTAAKWGTAITAGAAVAGTALTKFATSSASTADHIDKMSQKIGVSRTAYQELDFICSQSGADVDNLRTGMKTLTNQMQETMEGTGETATAFEKLGLSVVDEDGNMKSQEDMLWETLDALQGVSNQTERAALANDLFGKSGSDLMPLINGARGSIYEMKEQAHELGLVMNDEFIDNGVNLTDSLDQTKRAFGSVMTQLGGSLMPVVEQASDFVQAALPSIQTMVQSLAPVITKLFEKLLPPLMELIDQIFPVLVGLFEVLLPPITEIVDALLPVIVQLMKKLLPPVVQMVEALLPVLVELITALLPIVQPLLDLLLAVLKPLLKLVNIILPPLIELFSSIISTLVDYLAPAIEFISGIVDTVFNAALKTIQPIMQKVWDFIQKAWDAISEIFSSAFEGIKTVFSPMVKFFQDIWSGIKGAFSSVATWFKDVFSKAWTAVKNVFSTGGKIFDGIKDGIADVFKTVVNGIIGGINKVIAVPFKAINGMLSTLKNIDILGVEPFGWIKTFDVPEIPKLYRGGVLEKGQTGYLEGNGAEAVVPLEKNTEWISKVAADMEKATTSGNSKIIEDMLVTVKVLLEQLPETISNSIIEAIAQSLRFEWNDREFARIVKAVN